MWILGIGNHVTLQNITGHYEHISGLETKTMTHHTALLATKKREKNLPDVLKKHSLPKDLLPFSFGENKKKYIFSILFPDSVLYLPNFIQFSC